MSEEWSCGTIAASRSTTSLGRMAATQRLRAMLRRVAAPSDSS